MLIGKAIIPELCEYVVNFILPQYDKFDSAHQREHADMVIRQSEYVVNFILPQYDKFDSAHQREHADMVIRQSIELAEKLDVNVNIAYATAAFHDLGLINGREFHHVDSAKIVREDKMFPKWFSDEEINIIAEAVEDHRASAKNPPRSIYGRIVAEADRIHRSRGHYSQDHTIWC